MVDTAAPLDPVELAATLRPFGSSRTLPAAAYLDPAVLAWERRHLFAGGWTTLGRLADLRVDPTGGDLTQRALTAGDVGVLITFSGDGAPGGQGATVRGFANVCRHRGHELLPDGGTAGRPSTVCPYHGWAYRLDGTLASAPRLAGTDLAGLGLVPVPVATWAGWLMVNAGSPAPALVDYLGALDDLLRPYRMADLTRVARHGYRVAANWKVIIENYHECYHCPLIHPELCQVSPPASGENWDLPGAWVGGSMALRPYAGTMSLDGHGTGRFIDGAPRDSVRYLALFPNLLISAHPDYVLSHRLTPVAPGLTDVVCEWYMPAGVADARYAVEFWDLTNRQDWAACESVQRGLTSPHYRPGPLAGNEDAVYQWMALVAAAYLDPTGALTRACAPRG